MAKKGGQIGNNNAGKGKRLSSMLQARLAERGAEQELMNVLLDKALEGDMQAIKEIFDRVDGKPRQSVDLEATITKRLDELTDAELTDIATSSRK